MTQRKQRTVKKQRTTPENAEVKPDNPLDGVEYADEPTQPAPTQVAKDAQVRKDPVKPKARKRAPADPRDDEEKREAPKRTPEMAAANQKAAREAIERVKSQKRILREQRVPKSEPISAKQQEKIKPKAYRVVRAGQISRGAARYTIPVGKVVTDRNYNIDDLRNHGIGLELIES